MTIWNGVAILEGFGNISGTGTIPTTFTAAVHAYIEEEGGEQRIIATHLYIEETGVLDQRIIVAHLYIEEQYDHPNPAYPDEYDAGPMTQVVPTLGG